MKNILLVDDDEIIQNVCNRVLVQHGYNVVLGSNGQEGLDKLDQFKFDLVITDIMMPYLNGFEFINALKEHPHTKDAKLMIISSVTHAASISESETLGVNKYLSKPIAIQQFVDEVNKLLQE